MQGGALKMREWKRQEWIARVEIAGVENTGAKMYGKPSEQKITRKAWESLAYSSLGAIVSPPSEY